MAFISILTPVFNGVEFLDECIRSVKAQTFTDWELWIGVNGHGEDGGEVAQLASQLVLYDPRIHIVIQGPPLKGKVESLNHLVSFTTSDWIAVLDCDDKWEPLKLEKQVQAIHSHASDVVVVGTFCQYFGELHGKPTLESGYINPTILEHYNPIINSSSLIRREYCNWEYHENHNWIFEDFYLWMKICLSNKKLYNIPEYLVWHRIHKTSAFNSQGQTNDALRAWYKNARITASNKSD
jgi:teichuronic acid biosynthesis glycosyltransferase TuaG